MIFSKKNAGKWVASKGNRVVATGSKLQTLLNKKEVKNNFKSIVQKIKTASNAGVNRKDYS